MSHSAAEEEVSGRPKLSLQPRGTSVELSSPTTPKSTRPSPFGAARPREQVIAEREGKKETEVLKEQAKKEWKPQIVFTEAQREEKKAAEAELAFAKSELENEEDPAKATTLREEVAVKEKKLEELLASFEKLAVQAAQGGGTRRPFERRRDENPLPSPSMPYPGAYGSRDVAYGGRESAYGSREGAYGSREGAFGNDFGNFRSRGRDTGSDRVVSYGDTWGGARKSGGMSECYTCGEVGHFSRECPRGGSYGGNFGGGRSGGRQCYTCGQEGHFSRECPQSGGYGSRGGAYAGSFGGSQLGYDSSPYGMGAGGYGGNGYDNAGYESVRGSNYSAREYTGHGDR